MCSIRFLLSVGVMGCLLSQSVGAADWQRGGLTGASFMESTYYDTFTLDEINEEIQSIEVYLAGILPVDMMNAYNNVGNKRRYLERLLMDRDNPVPVFIGNTIQDLIGLMNRKAAIMGRPIEDPTFTSEGE
jgi:hypothetical protein